MFTRIICVFALSFSMLGLGTVASAATKAKRTASNRGSEETYSQRAPQQTISSASKRDLPLEGKLELEPNFGFSFLSPTDINTLIRDNNNSLQKQGVKSFNVGELGSSTNMGMAATYKVMDDVALGLGFNHVGSTSEGSAKINENTLNAKYEASANFLTVESRIVFARNGNGKFEAVAAPFAGIGFYKAATEFGGSAIDGSKEVNSSAGGFVFGANAIGRYWFNRSLAGGLMAGYRFAKSNPLKVDSQRNTDVAVGSTVENGGKKIQFDASAFMIGAQLTWAI